MRLFKLLALSTLSLSLMGCSIFSALGIDTNSTAAQDALKATEGVLEVYADIYQPAVITYGHLPVCVPGQLSLCKNTSVLASLKAIDLKATSAIVAARAILEGGPDTGSQLADAIATITTAETQIASTGVLGAKAPTASNTKLENVLKEYRL